MKTHRGFVCVCVSAVPDNIIKVLHWLFLHSPLQALQFNKVNHRIKPDSIAQWNRVSSNAGYQFVVSLCQTLKIKSDITRQPGDSLASAGRLAPPDSSLSLVFHLMSSFSSRAPVMLRQVQRWASEPITKPGVRLQEAVFKSWIHFWVFASWEEL